MEELLEVINGLKRVFMGIFSKDLIVQNYYAIDKKSCLEEMAEFLFEQGVILSSENFFKAIMERENLMSTGIGKNIAIPHARSDLVREIKIAVYVLDNELEFDSADDESVKVLFMIAVPEERKNEYMNILSSISNFLRMDENRNKLFGANTKEELFDILEEIEI